jgi:transposase-like protein
LDYLPQSVQPVAKRHLHEMYLAPTKATALAAFEEFGQLDGAKYPKACACLAKDRDVLFRFCDFSAEHWSQLRSTNLIESTLLPCAIGHSGPRAAARERRP